jgi:hypothetical protein
MLDDCGIRILSSTEQIFIFFTVSVLALEPTLPPIQWVLRDLFPAVKYRQVLEYMERYFHLFVILMIWCLFKHVNYFTLSF